MKPYQIVMGVLLAGAGGLVLFGDRSPSSDVAEAVVRSGASPSAARARVAAGGGSGQGKGDRQDQPQTAILRLQPRAQLIGESGEASFAQGEGVFLGQNWNPPPAAPPPVSTAPPPAPLAPPLPFVFIGKAAADGAWEVFLSRGDKVYVVRASTVIDGIYRVDKIVPPLMSVTYLPLNQVQQLNIGVLD